jgi:predicted O-methyltransferase YrrM
MLRTYQGQIKDLQLILEQINKKNLIMVEIGSFMGESMEIFANSGLFDKIYCVDPWKNGYDDTDGSSNMVEIAEATFDNKKSKFNFVEKIKSPSLEACERFENESIDMVYIDGNHQPNMVKKDIISWSQKIKKGGFICGHDWFYQDGLIQKTIIETIGIPDYICNHVMYGGEGDGSWIKIKN